jgi:hypothetical protein
MVLQPQQARVGSDSLSLGTSSRVAQLKADIAQFKEPLRQRQQIGIATGQLAQRFAITPERASTLTTDNADDENSGGATSRLRIVKDRS